MGGDDSCRFSSVKALSQEKGFSVSVCGFLRFLRLTVDGNRSVRGRAIFAKSLTNFR